MMTECGVYLSTGAYQLYLSSVCGACVTYQFVLYLQLMFPLVSVRLLQMFQSVVASVKSGCLDLFLPVKLVIGLIPVVALDIVPLAFLCFVFFF